ncbi:MAG: metallophosphoesterase [Pirellulaceae bacterium]
MIHFQPGMVLLGMLVGNCGFWLFLFNRLNGAGFPRRFTKRTEKLLVALCFVLPALIGLMEWQELISWLSSSRWWPAESTLIKFWGAWCLASGAVLGSLWVESRRWLIPPRNLLNSQANYFRIGRELTQGSTLDPLTTALSRLPGNQITHLEVTRKTLQIPRFVEGIEGFKIGHLSDIHFSGQFRMEHYQRVIDEFLQLEPDLIVLTGDIIDYDRYLPWLEPVLGRLAAPLGCTFLLGNHDRRLNDVQALLASLRDLGHFDIGSTDQMIELGSTSLWLTANEQPWFEPSGNRFGARFIRGNCE